MSVLPALRLRLRSWPLPHRRPGHRACRRSPRVRESAAGLSCGGWCLRSLVGADLFSAPYRVLLAGALRRRYLPALLLGSYSASVCLRSPFSFQRTVAFHLHNGGGEPPPTDRLSSTRAPGCTTRLRRPFHNGEGVPRATGGGFVEGPRCARRVLRKKRSRRIRGRVTGWASFVRFVSFVAWRSARRRRGGRRGGWLPTESGGNRMPGRS